MATTDDAMAHPFERGGLLLARVGLFGAASPLSHGIPHRRRLEQLDSAPEIADFPEEVELALWFHDAVYKPLSSKNELRSAEWARTFLEAAGADRSRSQRVYDHILATRHGDEPLGADAAVVVDIDLSILGRAPGTYDEFELAIRQEYKWVPWPVYRSKRIEILSSFLDRARIYATEHFRSRFEAPARRNLERAIETLRID